jgi:hypothetical protein
MVNGSGKMGLAQLASNSALVSDACASALRAFFSAPQRGR